LGGVQLRGRFSEYFGIEAAVEYRGKWEYKIADQSFETSFVPVTATALLFLPVNDHFVPYGVAGLGAYYTIYDSGGLCKTTRVILNLFQDLGFKHSNDILDSDPPAGGQNDTII